MIKAVIFDLDDTLYCENDFFHSGFSVVSRYLEAIGVGAAVELHKMIETIHASEGREGVLDKIVNRLGLPGQLAPELIRVFRTHVPKIDLTDEVAKTLFGLRHGYKLGCITDGWRDVQRRKIDALRLGTIMDAIVISDDYGRINWKPSPVPFLACCGLLGVSPGEAIFVGDNPERDMRGATNVGMRSIRIRRQRGYFRDYPCNGYEAAYEIVLLEELEPLLDAINAPAPCSRGRSAGRPGTGA